MHKCNITLLFYQHYVKKTHFEGNQNTYNDLNILLYSSTAGYTGNSAVKQHRGFVA